MLLLVWAAACDRGPDSSRPAPSVIAPSATAPSAGSSVGSAGVVPGPDAGVVGFRRVFDRAEAERDPAQTPCGQPLCGVDACAYPGGLGMTCLEALLAEPDPVVRGYLRRITDAQARLALEAPEVGAPPHPELAMNCGRGGPCRSRKVAGASDPPVQDDGYACLTAAEVARAEGDRAAQQTAHQRACRCDPERAQIPVMGGVLACDGPGQPSTPGRELELGVARDVVDCAACDQPRGPAACAAETSRLRVSAPELARYISEQRVPVCRGD